MIRSHRYRLLCASLLAAGAVSLGWLVPVWWLATPAPRAVISFPVDEEQSLNPWVCAGAPVFAPSGSLFAKIGFEPPTDKDRQNPEWLASRVVQLWDSQTGKVRADLCKLEREQAPGVGFSSDGKRVRVVVTEVHPLGPSTEPPSEIYRRCWDLATLTECDAGEPFQPFSPSDCPGLAEALELEMVRAQYNDGFIAFAPDAGAIVFATLDDEIRLGDARERTSRKIADKPRGRLGLFAVTPDAGQLVMNGPPHTSTGIPFLDRFWHRLDPELDNPDPDAEDYKTRETASYALDVASGRVLARWKTPRVEHYEFFPDGRTLMVVSTGQVAFYDTPFRDPWIQRLAVGLAAGAVTFVLAQVVLAAEKLSARLRAVVRRRVRNQPA